MSNPRYEVVIRRTDFWNHTYFMSGLYELAHQGEVELVLRPRLKVSDEALPEIIDQEYRNHRQPIYPVRSIGEYVVTDRETKRRLRVGVEYADDGDLFDRQTMEQSDIVFKRHYYPKYIDRLPPSLRAKVHPAGLIVGVRSPHETHLRRLRLAALANSMLPLKFYKVSTRRSFNKYVTNVLEDKGFQNLRYLPEVEQHDGSVQIDPIVLYQPRSWPIIDEKDLDKREMNEQRARMIRALRAAFGDRFVGGFTPTDDALARYPDCITNQPTDRLAYLQLVRHAAVVIYTRGLHFSPAKKLGEYLAAGKAIVCEPLTTELPKPLRHNHELVYYASEDDCVAQIQALFDDPERVQMLQRNALAYYRDQVTPSAGVRRIITQAFALTDEHDST